MTRAKDAIVVDDGNDDDRILRAREGRDAQTKTHRADAHSNEGLRTRCKYCELPYLIRIARRSDRHSFVIRNLA